jgi:acyl-CoA synthetase (AMP-forming)/AMP-acid ligase II
MKRTGSAKSFERANSETRQESARTIDTAFRAVARSDASLFPGDPTRSQDDFLIVRDSSGISSGWQAFSRGQIEAFVELAIASLPWDGEQLPISTTEDDPLTVVVGAMVAARTECAWVALNLRWPAEWLRERMAHVGPMWLLSRADPHGSWNWELAGATSVDARNVGFAASADASPASTTDSDVNRATIPLLALGACWVLFTSGTTGTPKAVVLSATALISSADAVTQALEVIETDVWYACMPLFHVGGLAIVLRTWRSGARLVSDRRFDEHLLDDAMRHHRCTLVSLVPTMLDRLTSARLSPPHSLRLSFIGGGPATPSLLQRATQAGWHPRFSYGLTEAASTVAVMPGDPVPGEPAWAGLALPCNQLTLSDVGGDGVGEILLNGPTLLIGHLQSDGLVSLRPDGPHATGDFGILRHDGLLRVVDRRTDLIVSGGENVYPTEVEQVLLEHPGVVDACVVGLPDERWGQRVVAAVVLREGTSDAELTEWFAAHLAAFARPRAVYQVAALPRNAMGKVERRLVREQLQATVPT